MRLLPILLLLTQPLACALHAQAVLDDSLPSGPNFDVAHRPVLQLRLSESQAGLTTLVEKTGYLGDLTSRTFTRLGDDRVPNYPTAWLPTERAAREWQSLVTPAPDSGTVSRR